MNSFLQHAMEAMVAVAVLVNCALIGLSGPVHRMLPDATPAQTILVIVALEVRGKLLWRSIEKVRSSLLRFYKLRDLFIFKTLRVCDLNG